MAITSYSSGSVVPEVLWFESVVTPRSFSQPCEFVLAPEFQEYLYQGISGQPSESLDVGVAQVRQKPSSWCSTNILVCSVFVVVVFIAFGVWVVLKQPWDVENVSLEATHKARP